MNLTNVLKDIMEITELKTSIVGNSFFVCCFVFSTDGDNLNPYILFFTCLVASVFSEDVWSWARTKLNQNLGNNTNTTGCKAACRYCGAVERTPSCPVTNLLLIYTYDL